MHTIRSLPAEVSRWATNLVLRCSVTKARGKHNQLGDSPAVLETDTPCPCFRALEKFPHQTSTQGHSVSALYQLLLQSEGITQKGQHGLNPSDSQ